MSRPAFTSAPQLPYLKLHGMKPVDFFANLRCTCTAVGSCITKPTVFEDAQGRTLATRKARRRLLNTVDKPRDERETFALIAGTVLLHEHTIRMHRTSD